ncbi:MAG: 3-hydroxybutyrate dehydrogenase [Notoacmeibacter sp.]
MASLTALITGSTSGIGLAIAKHLAKNGCKIVLNGLSPAEDIAPLLKEIEALSGTKAIFDGANMMDGGAIEALIKRTEAELGTIDILINNAGIQHVSPVEDFPPEKWDQIIAINLTSAFHTIRHTLPGMKERKFGRIVQIASAHALVASPFKSAYVAAKHGIAGLTKTIALEGAEHGVTVNAVCPGYVLTPLVQKQIPDQAKARGITEEAVVRDVLLAAQPSKKFVGAEEVAALVAHLCSAEAAGINGAIIPIDGGWTAH